MTDVLREMWTARVERRMEDVFLAKARLQATLESQPDRELEQEIGLIEVSTLRQQGDLTRADERLAQLRAILLDQGRPLPARFHIEAGLNDFYRENFGRALDSFLSATLCKPDPNVPWTTLQAQINACLCFEYLSIASPKLIARVQNELKKKIKRPHDMLRQWEAFENRHRFLNAEPLRPPAKKGWSQNSYFYALVTRIPLYHSGATSEVDSDLENYPKEYLGGFRMRTLLEKEDSADLNINKTSDLIERLYLWTWNTNLNPERSFDRLNLLTAEIASRSCNRTVLHRYMLRAALEWRAALDQGWNGTEFLRRVRQECPTESAPKFFSHEMKAIEGGAEKLSSTRLCGLKERIRRLKAHLLVVNQSSFEIARKGQTPMRSEPLARALAAVASQPVCSCRDLLYLAFGNPEYDELIHQGQLFNLLARMRDLLGEEFSITKRRHMIYAQGPFAKVHFVGHTPAVMRSPELGQPAGPKAGHHPLKLLPPPLRGRPFSRRDLERGLGKSRASANRLLSQWVRQQFVQTIGNGKSILYQVDKKWSDT